MQNIQLVTMYEQYGSIKRNALILKLLTNITFTHCSSVQCLKYFHSNYSLLQNYISGRKEAVHIKYVRDLGLRLKLGTF